jgi:hypothetical protein
MKLNVAITEEELRDIISNHLKAQGLIPSEDLEESIVFSMLDGENGPVFVVEVSGVTVAPKPAMKTVPLSSVVRSTKSRVVNLDEEDPQSVAKDMAELQAQSAGLAASGPRLGKKGERVPTKIFTTFDELGKDPSDIKDEI